MTSRMQRPRKKWSIFALAAAGAFAVVLSYTLLIALAIGGFALPYLFFHGHPINASTKLATPVGLSIFGVVAAINILWSLFPRRQSIEAPGPRIELGRETRLATEIASVAAALDQEMPTDIYLVADANAFVAQRPGTGGEGNRKILALGLPLMQGLTISEFRAILAHEFAHFYAGDTRLGPWVYQGHTTIVRVYNNLGSKSLLSPLFEIHYVTRMAHRALLYALRGYWTLFLRATQLISRQQEFRCDELACYVAGSAPLASALRRIHGCGAVTTPFWRGVVLPAVKAGFRPQLADSFGRYLTAPHIAAQATAFLDQEAQNTKASHFDSHPPLGARVARADALGLPDPANSDAGSQLRAISLIDDLAPLEAAILSKLLPKVDIAGLKPLVWEDSARDLYIPAWRQEIAEFLPHLATTRLASLPELVLNPSVISDRLPVPRGRSLTERQREERTERVLSVALSLALVEGGWNLQIQPAMRRLQHGDVTLTAEEIIARLRSRVLPASGWRDLCQQTGIGDLPLAPAIAA